MIPAGIHTVMKIMDEMGLTSRIRHSHFLRQRWIYPVNVTGIVPRVKGDTFISGAT